MVGCWCIRTRARARDRGCDGSCPFFIVVGWSFLTVVVGVVVVTGASVVVWLSMTLTLKEG